MKGLLLKELLNLKVLSRSLIGVLVFYLFFLFTGNDMSFISALCTLVVVMLSVSTFSIDEKARWDRYALTFPISRKEMVRSKYFLALILEGAALSGGMSLSFLSMLLLGQSLPPAAEWLLSWYVVGLVGILMTSIIFPLIYRFGIDKARLCMMAVFLIPSGILLLIERLGISVVWPSGKTIELWLFSILPVVAAGILWVSYWISCRIYLKKEF